MKPHRKLLLPLLLAIVLTMPALSGTTGAAPLLAVDDADTKSLLHLNGEDGSTTITDEAGISWTANGDAQLDQAQEKYGLSSALFDGTGDYLSSTDSVFNVGSGDFTIDFWVYVNSPGHTVSLINKRSSNTAYGWNVLFWNHTNNNLEWYAGSNNSGWDIINAKVIGSIASGSWHHIALVRSGNTWKGFVDGTQGGGDTTSSASLYSPAAGLNIGSDTNTNAHKGWIDEFRFSTIARWTSNFTPPSLEYEPAATPTPTATNTLTATYTPTETLTPTITYTPTETPTITQTNTITQTPTLTPSITRTPSNTSTVTLTPTATNTLVPGTGITWVDVDTINFWLLEGMGRYLLANPPEGEDGDKIYTVADSQAGDDGNWLISIVNLVNVTPPDYEWNIEDNSAWMGSLDCLEDPEDYWSCILYVPDLTPEYDPTYLPSGSENSIVFPWQPGTRAQLGIGCAGGCTPPAIHGQNSTFLPGSRAVDFFGTDNQPNSVMPAYAYGATNGVVSFVCRGSYNTTIVVDSPNGKMMYAHLSPSDSSLVIGLNVYAGQVISSLVKGSFSDNCGWASQSVSEYHLHYGFIPVGGYFSIGGCNLNMSTGYFLCGTTSYGVGSWIPNGSSSPALQPTVGAGTPTITPVPGSGYTSQPLGGEHIWDGMINGIVSGTQELVSLFPASGGEPGPYADAIKSVIFTGVDLFYMFFSTASVWGLTVYFFGLILAGEAVMLVIRPILALGKAVVKFLGSLSRFLPL